MPSVERDAAIILRRIEHGETSLIVTAFSREHGKLGLIAKGARSKSKLGSSAALELLAESQIVYYYKATRDLQLLKEWTLLSPHTGLRSSLDHLTIALAIAELLGRCLRDGDPVPVFYDVCTTTLRALNERPGSPLPLLWKLELDLFEAQGFGVRLKSCALSRRPLIAPFRHDVRYRLADGSFIHWEAEPAERFDGALSGEAYAVLIKLPEASVRLAGRIAAGLRVQKELNSFFARYIETHLSVRGRLRALDALTWGQESSQAT